MQWWQCNTTYKTCHGVVLEIAQRTATADGEAHAITRCSRAPLPSWWVYRRKSQSAAVHIKSQDNDPHTATPMEVDLARTTCAPVTRGTTFQPDEGCAKAGPRHLRIVDEVYDSH